MNKVHDTRRLRHGFTLIELLVVIAIIGVLIGLTLGIGNAVIGSGKARQTADTIKVLDNILTEHRAATDAPVPWFVKAPGVGNAPGWIIPLADGVWQPDSFNGAQQTKSQIPTLAWFLKSVTEYSPVPTAEALLDSIDGKLKKLNVDQTGGNVVAIDRFPGKRIDVVDAWGNPIRMVHPKFAGVIPSPASAVGNDGGPMQTLNTYVIPPTGGGVFVEQNFRRNYVSDADRQARKSAGQPPMKGDSDGGSCQGDTPYFYSAGPDGDPSTREDNVYTIRPKFADKN
jgi:prepilin-type N-terminal cleavage/methylation domain-containing protein